MLSRFPIPDTTVTAEAIASATATAIGDQDVGELLANILIELKIITVFIQQGLGVEDSPEIYRNNPDNQF